MIRIPDYVETPLIIKPAGQVIDYWHALIGSLESKSTGKRAAIFYLDTAGEFNHPDLGDEGNQYKGNSTPDPAFDKHGHGHLCGGVGSAKDNGFGARGVAPDSLGIPRKGLRDDGRGFINELAKEVHSIVDTFERGLKGKYIPVLSMSFGGGSPSSAMNAALDRAAEAGFVLVAAAGNNNGPVIYPASHPKVIAVPAFGPDDKRASFSAYGPKTDVTAYGVSIFTTNNKGGYSRVSGTSFSCPMVAGAVGLLVDTYFDEFKDAGPKANELAMQHLKEFARDVLEKGEDDYSGAGVIDIPNMLANTPVFREDPPEEDEPDWEKEEREILVPVDQQMDIVWGAGIYPGEIGTRSVQSIKFQSGRRMLTIERITASTKERMTYPALHDKVLRETIRFFHNRGLMLFKESDSWDAAKWAAHFLGMFMSKSIPTYKIKTIHARDEQGREIVLEV